MWTYQQTDLGGLAFRRCLVPANKSIILDPTYTNYYQHITTHKQVKPHITKSPSHGSGNVKCTLTVLCTVILCILVLLGIFLAIFLTRNQGDKIEFTVEVSSLEFPFNPSAWLLKDYEYGYCRNFENILRLKSAETLAKFKKCKLETLTEYTEALDTVGTIGTTFIFVLTLEKTSKQLPGSYSVYAAIDAIIVATTAGEVAGNTLVFLKNTEKLDFPGYKGPVYPISDATDVTLIVTLGVEGQAFDPNLEQSNPQLFNQYEASFCQFLQSEVDDLRQTEFKDCEITAINQLPDDTKRRRKKRNDHGSEFEVTVEATTAESEVETLTSSVSNAVENTDNINGIPVTGGGVVNPELTTPGSTTASEPGQTTTTDTTTSGQTTTTDTTTKGPLTTPSGSSTTTFPGSFTTTFPTAGQTTTPSGQTTTPSGSSTTTFPTRGTTTTISPGSSTTTFPTQGTTTTISPGSSTTTFPTPGTTTTISPEKVANPEEGSRRKRSIGSVDIDIPAFLYQGTMSAERIYNTTELAILMMMVQDDVVGENGPIMTIRKACFAERDCFHSGYENMTWTLGAIKGTQVMVITSVVLSVRVNNNIWTEKDLEKMKVIQLLYKYSTEISKTAIMESLTVYKKDLVSCRRYNGGCSGSCFQSYVHPGKYSCSCPKNMVLQKDGRHCANSTLLG